MCIKRRKQSLTVLVKSSLCSFLWKAKDGNEIDHADISLIKTKWQDICFQKIHNLLDFESYWEYQIISRSIRGKNFPDKWFGHSAFIFCGWRNNFKFPLSSCPLHTSFITISNTTGKYNYAMVSSSCRSIDLKTWGNAGDGIFAANYTIPYLIMYLALKLKLIGVNTGSM